MSPRRLLVSVAVLASVALGGQAISPPPGPSATARADDGMTIVESEPVWTDHFGELVATIERDYPEDFSSGWVNPDQQSGGIRFKGDVPAAARALAASLPNVTVVAERSVAQDSQIASDILRSADEALRHERHVGVTHRQDTNTVTVTVGRAVDNVHSPAAFGPAEAERLAASLRERHSMVELSVLFDPSFDNALQARTLADGAHAAPPDPLAFPRERPLRRPLTTLPNDSLPQAPTGG